MTSHELAKILLESNDAPITATVEISTGVKDKYGDEIIAHLECFGIIEVIANQYEPNTPITENIIKFTESESRATGIDVVKVISDFAKKKEEK